MKQGPSEALQTEAKSPEAASVVFLPPFCLSASNCLELLLPDMEGEVQAVRRRKGMIDSYELSISKVTRYNERYSTCTLNQCLKGGILAGAAFKTFPAELHLPKFPLLYNI